LIIPVTLAVVAVLEGLPLAVTLALTSATKRMTTKKLLVHILSASIICTEKTRTLAQNITSAAAGSISIHAKFVHNPKNRTLPMLLMGPNPTANTPTISLLSQDDINTILSPQLKRLFNQSITINSAAFEDIYPKTQQLAFIGSNTETALLRFTKDLSWENWKETHGSG
jgi:Ca2+-transporting ATPase